MGVYYIMLYYSPMASKASEINLESFIFLSLPCKSKLTDLLTPWFSLSWNSCQDVTCFHGTRNYITVFRRAFHWTLSWASRIHSTPSHPISVRIIFNVLPPRVGLPSRFSCISHNNRYL